jgi:starch phosphorylase
VDEVAELRKMRHRPRDVYRSDSNVRRVLDLLRDEFFNPSEPGLYHSIVDSLLGEDYYLLLADFDAYRRAQLEVDRAFSDRGRWNRCRSPTSPGSASPYRTIREYARDIWQLEPRPGGGLGSAC